MPSADTAYTLYTTEPICLLLYSLRSFNGIVVFFQNVEKNFCSASSSIASGVLIGVQESVAILFSTEPFTSVTFSNLAYLVDTSVGSVPFLNNSVIYISLGVNSLGSFAG